SHRAHRGDRSSPGAHAGSLSDRQRVSRHRNPRLHRRRARHGGGGGSLRCKPCVDSARTELTVKMPGSHPRILAICAPMTLFALIVNAPLHAQSAQVAAVLREVKAADTDLLAVSEEDGRLLRVMAASRGAKSALEIGSAFGYSAIWIALGLRETGGHLTTIEYDASRARVAADNIRRAGLSDIVTVLSGDGFEHIPKLSGTFDFV